MGGEVRPVCVDLDADATDRLLADWERWACGLDLVVLPSPHRDLVAPVIAYVREQTATGRNVTVLLPETQPRKRRYTILHNQRALVLASAIRSRTTAIVAIVTLSLNDDARVTAGATGSEPMRS